MKSPRSLALLFLGCVTLATTLSSAEFRALSWDTTLNNVTYPGLSPTSPPLSISAAALGTWQKIVPSADGIDFKTLPPPSSPNNPQKPTATPLAKVLWPAGVNRALLLFVPTPTGTPTPYTVIVIPERDADASPAALRVFNFSDRNIALRLGSQAPAQLAPLATFDSDDRPASGAQTLTLAYREEPRWRIAADTSLALPPGFSAYVFILNIPRFDLEPNNPVIGYKLIYDRLPAATQPGS